MSHALNIIELTRRVCASATLLASDRAALSAALTGLRESGEYGPIQDLADVPAGQILTIQTVCNILDGIDQTQGGKPDVGWWETSDGAIFGAARLAELLARIEPETLSLRELGILVQQCVAAERLGWNPEHYPTVHLALDDLTTRVYRALGAYNPIEL